VGGRASQRRVSTPLRYRGGETTRFRYRERAHTRVRARDSERIAIHAHTDREKINEQQSLQKTVISASYSLHHCKQNPVGACVCACMSAREIGRVRERERERERVRERARARAFKHIYMWWKEGLILSLSLSLCICIYIYIHTYIHIYHLPLVAAFVHGPNEFDLIFSASAHISQYISQHTSLNRYVS